MAATIVTHASRVPFPADLAARVADEQAESLGIPSIGVAGDTNVTAGIPLPPGQLWERVAERGWALDDLTTVERNQVWPWRHGDNRGPQIPAVAWPEVARHTSGIIHAGERIK